MTFSAVFSVSKPSSGSLWMSRLKETMSSPKLSRTSSARPLKLWVTSTTSPLRCQVAVNRYSSGRASLTGDALDPNAVFGEEVSAEKARDAENHHPQQDQRQIHRVPSDVRAAPQGTPAPGR